MPQDTSGAGSGANGAPPAKTALVFPGQGSQGPGMRAVVERFRPELIELARGLIGDLPFARADDGTEFAQPAIFCAGIAEFTRWSLSNEEPPALMAGHSLGEIIALVAAGSIGADDGLRLVAKRGELMQAACERSRGGMVAVLGTHAENAGELGAELGLVVSNDNCPGQVVLSGPRDRIAALVERADRSGIRVKQLNVAGAFHSPAMESAVPEFVALLDELQIGPPRIPVISGVTAQPFDDVRLRLAESLTRPVLWRQVVERLHAGGVERFVEIGPGKVLTGLIKRTLRKRRGSRRLEPAHA